MDREGKCGDQRVTEEYGEVGGAGEGRGGEVTSEGIDRGDGDPSRPADVWGYMTLY